jgi:EmrB/QacA subfamily drug resistance transporter
MLNTANQSKTADSSFKNRSKILIIVLTASFMAVLDFNVVSIALPTITTLFNVPVGLSQWILTSYQVTMTVTALIFGKLADYIGKSRLFIIGFLIFTVSSLACGLSTFLAELVLFRILQAIGASMVLSINLAILMQIFPENEKGKVMGYFTAIIGLGMLIGPTVGGFIVDVFGWPYIFFINIPIGIALIIPAVKYLKIEEHLTKENEKDYLGALLFIIAVGTFFMVLNDLASKPVNLSMFILYSAVCAVSLAAFIGRELTAKKPMLEIALFKIQRFTLSAVSLVLYFTATFILVLIQPFYFEGVMGFNPSTVGILAAVMPLAMMVSSPISGRIYDNLKLHSHSWIVKNYPLVGITVMGLTYLICGYAFWNVNLILIIAMFLIAGVCRSIFQGPNNIDIMNSLPPEKGNIASGMINTTTNFGLAFGTAMGAVLLASFVSFTGYSGNVLYVGASTLAGVCGVILYISGILCLVGGLLSYRK